jgi:DNA-binding HxlR family transcriptional regulator
MLTRHPKVTEDPQDVYAGECPARALLDRIANKWATMLVGLLAENENPVRFGDIRRQITGISQKMLTQTLRDLERDGLVVRRAYPVIPPRVEYSLTALGRTLEEPMRALSEWAERHMADVHAAQQRFDRERLPVGERSA